MTAMIIRSHLKITAMTNVKSLQETRYCLTLARYVAASAVTDTHTDRQTHRITTIPLVHAPRVNTVVHNIYAHTCYRTCFTKQVCVLILCIDVYSDRHFLSKYTTLLPVPSTRPSAHCSIFMLQYQHHIKTVQVCITKRNVLIVVHTMYWPSICFLLVVQEIKRSSCTLHH